MQGIRAPFWSQKSSGHWHGSMLTVRQAGAASIEEMGALLGDVTVQCVKLHTLGLHQPLLLHILLTLHTHRSPHSTAQRAACIDY